MYMFLVCILFIGKRYRFVLYTNQTQGQRRTKPFVFNNTYVRVLRGGRGGLKEIGVMKVCPIYLIIPPPPHPTNIIRIEDYTSHLQTSTDNANSHTRIDRELR